MDHTSFTDTIVQGSAWSLSFIVADDQEVPEDLSRYSAKAEMKLSAKDATNSIAIVATVSDTPGTVELALSAASTSTLVPGKRHLFDVCLYIPGDAFSVFYPLQGTLLIAYTITRGAL